MKRAEFPRRHLPRIPALVLAVAFAALSPSCRPLGGADGPRQAPVDAIPPFDAEKLEIFYELSPDQAESLIGNSRDITILDIRRPEHFSAAHLIGARNLPFPSPGFQREVASLGTHTKVLIYGYSRDLAIEEKNGMDAVNVLRQLDFRTIYYLTEGYPGWIGAGKVVVDSEGRVVEDPPLGPMPEPKPETPGTVPPAS